MIFEVVVCDWFTIEPVRSAFKRWQGSVHSQWHKILLLNQTKSVWIILTLIESKRAAQKDGSFIYKQRDLRLTADLKQKVAFGLVSNQLGRDRRS